MFLNAGAPAIIQAKDFPGYWPKSSGEYVKSWLNGFYRKHFLDLDSQLCGVAVHAAGV